MHNISPFLLLDLFQLLIYQSKTNERSTSPPIPTQRTSAHNPFTWSTNTICTISSHSTLCPASGHLSSLYHTCSLSKTCSLATFVLLSSFYVHEQKRVKCASTKCPRNHFERRRTGALCAEIVHTTAATTDNVRAHKFIHIWPHHSKCKISILTTPLR